MALSRITCPYCEADIEVDVSSADESCPCPKCGRQIELEITKGQKRAKHTALKVPAVDAVEKLGEVRHSSHAPPAALEGLPHDRLKHDPEVKRCIRHLIWGASALAAVIALLTLADMFGWWSAIGSSSSGPPADATASTPTTPPVAAAKKREPELPDARTVLTRSPVAPIVLPPNSSPPPEKLPRTGTPPPILFSASKTLPEEERAIQVLSAFLNANSVEERLRLVRDATTIESSMRAYYSAHPDGPIPFTAITPDAVPPGGSPVRTFQVKLPDGSSRRATLGRIGSGDFRIDWGSFVLYSAMDWDALRERRPTKPVFMRVLMEPASRFDGAFADAQAYVCVKLTDPLHVLTAPIYAYAPRQSTTGKSLNLMLQTVADNPVPAMVMVKYPTQDQSIAQPGDQLLLDRLIGEGWLASGM